MDTLEITLPMAKELYKTADADFKKVLEEKFTIEKLSDNILDRVKNIDDIFEIAKADKKLLTNISDSVDEVGYKICKLIAKALNNQPKEYDLNKNIWFPVFDIRGSGFVFSASNDDYYYVYTAVGSALRFKDQVTCDFAAKLFIEYYKKYMVFNPSN